jgi:hypothetical protein
MPGEVIGAPCGPVGTAQVCVQASAGSSYSAAAVDGGPSWGVRFRFVLRGSFPAEDYLASWKMMPSVWRCPRCSLLTPWRKFAR